MTRMRDEDAYDEYGYRVVPEVTVRREDVHRAALSILPRQRGTVNGRRRPITAKVIAHLAIMARTWHSRATVVGERGMLFALYATGLYTALDEEGFAALEDLEALEWKHDGAPVRQMRASYGEMTR